MSARRRQVLSIGETVEEVNDSGFLSTVPTLRTQLLADDSMLQVCRAGRRPRCRLGQEVKASGLMSVRGCHAHLLSCCACSDARKSGLGKRF